MTHTHDHDHDTPGDHTTPSDTANRAGAGHHHPNPPRGNNNHNDNHSGNRGDNRGEGRGLSGGGSRGGDEAVLRVDTDELRAMAAKVADITTELGATVTGPGGPRPAVHRDAFGDPASAAAAVGVDSDYHRGMSRLVKDLHAAGANLTACASAYDRAETSISRDFDALAPASRTRRPLPSPRVPSRHPAAGSAGGEASPRGTGSTGGATAPAVSGDGVPLRMGDGGFVTEALHPPTHRPDSRTPSTGQDS
jgi:hypothetical protein